MIITNLTLLTLLCFLPTCCYFFLFSTLAVLLGSVATAAKDLIIQFATPAIFSQLSHLLLLSATVLTQLIEYKLPTVEVCHFPLIPIPHLHPN